MKDLSSSMNQNNEHINHDSSLRWNKRSAQQQTNSETLEQQKSNSWISVGPTKDRSSGPSQLYWKLYVGAIIIYAGAIIKSEAQPIGVQLKVSAKLLTVNWLTTKHVVSRITFMLYPILLYRMIIFLNWSEKSFQLTIFLNLFTKSP